MYFRIIVAVATFAIVASSLAYSFYEKTKKTDEATSELHAVIEGFRKAEQEKKDLLDFALRAMNVVQSPLSAAMRQIVAKQISEVTYAQVKDQSKREAFIVLLAIESKFTSRAKSSVGAIGIGQLMPQFATDFAAECGFGETKIGADDLADTELNLRLSACHFNQLLAQLGGNGALALAAYNAGLYSKTRKDFERLQNVNDETANYVAKHAFVSEAIINEGKDSSTHATTKPSSETTSAPTKSKNTEKTAPMSAKVSEKHSAIDSAKGKHSEKALLSTAVAKAKHADKAL